MNVHFCIQNLCYLFLSRCWAVLQSKLHPFGCKTEMVFIVLREIDEDRTEINILEVHAFNTMCFQMKNYSEARIQIFKTLSFQGFVFLHVTPKPHEQNSCGSITTSFSTAQNSLTLSIIVLSSFIENLTGNHPYCIILFKHGA